MNQVTESTRAEEVLMNRVYDGIKIMNSESEQNLSRMEEISQQMENTRRSTTDIASSSHEIADLSGRLKSQADRFSL
ncbi:MAG: hypothetical protein LUQ07_01825 [Methanospirillum sp.]|nr:hypothetical protein [Methanospirillum sp.]